MLAVIFPSHIWESLTRNVLQLPIINFGVQHKWMLMEIIMDIGRTVIKIATRVENIKSELNKVKYFWNV